MSYERVDGHGMNLEELKSNRRLANVKVADLNADPFLPFESGEKTDTLEILK